MGRKLEDLWDRRRCACHPDPLEEVVDPTIVIIPLLRAIKALLADSLSMQG